MPRVVSNATPLIYLAKCNRLDFLLAVSEEVYIPEAVYHEVVTKGKLFNETDALRVESTVKQGLIIVRKPLVRFSTEISLHPGEAEVISLAKEMGISLVLMDDLKARNVAQIAGLRPLGTLGVLLKALNTGMLTFDGFLEALSDLVKAGFYLNEVVCLQAIKEARRISSETGLRRI